MQKIKLQIDNYSRIFFAGAFVIAVIEGLLIILVRSKLPPQVPLYYSLPWGDSQLTSPHALWWLPAICIVIIVVNLIISIFLKQLVLTRILSSGSLLAAMLAIITLGKIIMLETL